MGTIDRAVFLQRPPSEAGGFGFYCVSLVLRMFAAH